jgi:hypothetical protein
MSLGYNKNVSVVRRALKTRYITVPRPHLGQVVSLDNNTRFRGIYLLLKVIVWVSALTDTIVKAATRAERKKSLKDIFGKVSGR